MPALGVDFQLGVHPGLLQILHKALTVGLQNFVCAYLYQRRGQTAQVGKERAVARARPVGIGAGVGLAHGGDVLHRQHRVQCLAGAVALSAGRHIGPWAEQHQPARLGTALLLQL